MQRRAAAPLRRITAEAAGGLVRSGMWLDYSGALAQPDLFDRALAARAGELADVKIRNCLTVRPRAFLEADPTGAHFHCYSWHFSGYDRARFDAGACHYTPLNLGEVPDYYRRFIEPVDIVVLKARPEGPDGVFNFGPTNAWSRSIIERARMVVVEESASLPHAFGPENGVGRDEVDFVIDGDESVPPELANPPINAADVAVAQQIAAEIGDGACLQIGIGAMPDAVCRLLKESGVRNLGVHTEMLTDGIMELVGAGLVTGARKQIDPGKVVYTFALGSAALYAAIDNNPDLACCPADYTNLPHIIMRNDNVVSINSTMQIDLQGQASSESIGHRHITGTGGQLQFVRGAYASVGGKSFICLPSTHGEGEARKSRIVIEHPPGTIATTPRSDVMYVVTEWGMANLKGLSVAERARAMIGLAHPDFRDDLERDARERRLIPRPVAGHG